MSSYKTPPPPTQNDPEQVARNRLATCVHPTMQEEVQAALQEAYQLGRTAISLEGQVESLRSHGLDDGSLATGIREVVQEPQGELAFALSEQNSRELERIICQRGWQGLEMDR